MKTSDLRNLQALRQLREQRASSQLATQQQRCRDTHDTLDDAKERLRLHRESIARKAESIYGKCSEGLSINAWLAAQDHLDDLANSQQQMEVSVCEVAQSLQTQEQEREVFRAAHMSRQRQAESCDALLNDRVLGERRASEYRDEADEVFRAASGGGS